LKYAQTAALRLTTKTKGNNNNDNYGGAVAVAVEHGNDLDYIKDGKFPEQLCDYQLLNMDSVPQR
jgi:hypothetical protein